MAEDFLVFLVAICVSSVKFRLIRPCWNRRAMDISKPGAKVKCEMRGARRVKSEKYPGEPGSAVRLVLKI